MGFILQVGHPRSCMMDDAGARIASELVQVFGATLPLGTPGESWSTEDTVISQMGWSWWSAMQDLVAEQIGRASAPHALAIEAWFGVYLDTRTPPGVLRQGRILQPRRDGPIARFRAKHHAKKSVMSAISEAMMNLYGSNRTDAGHLKVGDLRCLRQELELTIRSLGHKPDDGAMNDLLHTFHGPSMDRCEEEIGLQCLAHSWIATSKAIEMNSPLWLIK